MKKRRSWSDDEKRKICQQTMPPGVSVAQVARCYAMNAKMIYNWLKNPRFAPPAVALEDKQLYVHGAVLLLLAVGKEEQPIASEMWG